MRIHLKDKKRYEDFVLGHAHGNLWQSWVWGEFQHDVGRRVMRFGWEQNEKLVATAQIIEHRGKFGMKYWYVPRGPLFYDARYFEQLVLEITEAAKVANVTFVKFDPFENVTLPKNLHLRESNSSQPKDTLMIDLRRSEDEILQLMKQKGRYNIKMAKKYGVTVAVSCNKVDVEHFFALLQATTKRDRFRGHDIAYYENMLRHLGDNAQLIMAYYNNKPVAGGIFTFYGGRAIYYYGASADEYKNLMAPYAVQWAAIQSAKKRGCREYDFLGIAPAGAKNHSWAGVTEFKRKFGGDDVCFPQPFDVVLKPLRYWAYRLILLL